MKKIFAVVGLLAVLGLGLYVGYKFNQKGWFSKTSAENSTVLLQEIKDVMKLVAVEGYFSEVYDYKDYSVADWNMFSKKALIRVKAKVSVGYNLESVSFRADEGAQTIYIGPMPAPEILSIDHDLDYYDIQQGTFNTFTNADYNMLNKRAKKFIETQVKESELFNRAERQKQRLEGVLRTLAQSQGWTVVIESSELVD
jgi:hypothetical protein